MSQNMLLGDIAKSISLTKEEEDHFASLLKYKKIKRKKFLLLEGETQKHHLFVTAGCMRSYSIDENGYEHILQFAPPGWWLGDMHSLITAQPSIMSIDAAVDSEVIMLLKYDLDQLFIEIPKLERFFRILAQKALAANQRRLINILSLNALKRYEYFCELYPSLVTNIPQKDIASYIGVTPEFLSKIRHQTK